jgi:hypothetical protein
LLCHLYTIDKLFDRRLQFYNFCVSRVDVKE